MRKKQHMRNAGRKSGYTLVEMVIILVVVSILITVVWPYVVTNIRSYFTVSAGKAGLEAGRIAFNRMISELRRIEGQNEILEVSKTSLGLGPWTIRFRYYDLETHKWETVQYGYSMTNLWLWRNNESNRFIEGVTDFTITCYNRNGNVITPVLGMIDESQIWRMQIEIRLGRSDKTGFEYRLVQEIHPKSFGLRT